MFNLFFSENFGELFKVKYALPKYSPISPRAKSWMPPKNKIITIKDVHPTGIWLDISLKKTSQIEIQKLAIENNIPSKEAILKGKTEKPVAILSHKLTNFKTV